MGKFLKYLFQIILSPTRGWEDMSVALDRHEVNVRRMYLCAFLPLIGVCSASAFVRMFYGQPNDALWCLATTIISFVTMFLTYHLSIYAISAFMPKFVDGHTGRAIDQRQLALVVMMSVAFIVLVTLLQNVVKVNLAIISFLPLYVVFILWKACRFLDVMPRQEGLYMLLSSLAVLGSYYLLGFIFSALLI